MKKILFFLSSLAMGGLLQAQQVNDPNAEVREAKGFHGISVNSSLDVYLSQGGTEAVAVSASETKYRDHIKVEVKDGLLIVRYDNEGLHWGSGNKKLKAYISFKDIDKLDISGACDVFITGSIKAENLKVTLSGASDLKGKLEAKKLIVDISGASDMTVSGASDQLDVEASGASNFKGFDFTTDVCNARASGASDIKITVNKELTAHATGASDVRYKGGDVKTDIKTSGSSSVSKSKT